MLDIVDITFAHTIDISLIAHLRAKIHDHHTEFTHLYPDASVIPKMHFMVHYPTLIMRYSELFCHLLLGVMINFRFGPLSRLWCVRFEAKNSYFKRLAQSIGNFKNVCKTVVTRHQRLSCYNLANDSSIFCNELMHTGKGWLVTIVL